MSGYVAMLHDRLIKIYQIIRITGRLKGFKGDNRLIRRIYIGDYHDTFSPLIRIVFSLPHCNDSKFILLIQRLPGDLRDSKNR